MRRLRLLVLVSMGLGFFVNLLYNSVVALRGLVTGLNASAATRVDYQSLITYRPWMGFGETPGHTIARGAGARVMHHGGAPGLRYRIGL